MLTISVRNPVYTRRTRLALREAEGYMQLQLYREALKALDSIDPLEQEQCDVLIARGRVLLHLHRYVAALKLSQRGARLYAHEEEFTVQHAFALSRLHREAAADRFLEKAPQWLKNSGILQYNLGCYEARWGNLENARKRINAAIQINTLMERNARRDPDLAALWN